MAPAATAPARPKRWVDAEIATLDGRRDYARIVNLIAEYKLNDFVMNLVYTTGFMSNTVPVGGSDVIYGTGKAEARPQTRYLDTVKFFWQWFFKGPEAPEVQASVVRLNRLHAHLYERFPESFTDNDEWVFTLCNLAVGPDRMRSLVGAAPTPENVQLAWHTFWTKLGEQMTTPQGAVVDIPASYADMLRFAEEFERREYAYTPTGNALCLQLIRQFNERFLPRPLHGLGRQLVLTFVPEAVRRRHDLPDANRAAAWLVKRAFKLIFTGQDRFIPDNKVPTSQALATQKYQDWKKDVTTQEKRNPLTPARG